MSRTTETIRKALEWAQRDAVGFTDDLSATEVVHHDGRPWVEDWQTEWAETTLDVVERTWRDCGSRMYRSRGELYDDLRGFLVEKAQEVANKYEPRWQWNDPERAWGAYLWSTLHEQARWHFASTIGKRNDENHAAYAQMNDLDLRIEALMSRATPAGQERLERTLSPMLAWRPMSPERYVEFKETVEERLHDAQNGTLPPAQNDGCAECYTRAATRPGQLCEYCYRKSLELWRDGPRCQHDGCPDAATIRSYCKKHYGTERARRLAAGNLWEKRTYPDICTVEGCDRPHDANGLCSTHASQARRAKMPPCTVDGCDRPQDSKGLCPHHRVKAKEATAPPCEVDGCETGAVLKAKCRKHYRQAARAEGRNA